MLLISTMMQTQSNFKLYKDHDAILVKDVNVSANFYKEVLGLKEISNGGLSAHVRWFQLGDMVQLHLIESKALSEKHKGVHMALNTSSLSELMDFLRSKNVSFENWPGEKDTTNTRPDGIKQIYFQDPDGYWIEVNDNSL